MNYPEWLKTVPKELAEDSLWRMDVPDQRGQILHEEALPYMAQGERLSREMADNSDWSGLLANVPLP